MHGKKRRRKLSEYGIQLREKQQVRKLYGMRERQFRNIVREASRKAGSNTDQLYRFLESRLDNVVFRLGFTPSRSVARQIVSHGHMTVNGKRVTIPSYRVRAGDLIAIRAQSGQKGFTKDLDILLKKFQAPAWLELDKTKKEGTVVSLPIIEDVPLAGQLGTIIGFYSR